jgi:hypothetical protein
MFGSFNNLFGQKPPQKGGPMFQEPLSGGVPSQQSSLNRGGPSYSKVFRWRLPDGQTEAPSSVEVIGSFNHWQRALMTRDSVLDAWHVTVHHIPGNRTHHYMFLVEGKPAYDKNCDGLAAPHGPQEEQYALTTDRGTRVFMLFAQAK